MGEINIPRQERDALRAIDTGVLGELIAQSVDERHSCPLRVLQLENCGLYAATQLRAFEKALMEYEAAKAPKKVAETEYRAHRAGSNLAHAIQQMKERAATEEREAQFFYVDDLIATPNRLSVHLTVHVNYRWRSKIDDKWQYGSVAFTHDVDLPRDYTMPRPKRKPSARKLEEDRQDNLYRQWEYLMRLGLYSVRDFFREGGDGAAIPETFQVKADVRTRALNNFSARFWPVSA